MTNKAPTIVNMHTAPEVAADVPAAWTHFRRALTSAMKDAGPGRFGMGRLGMGAVRVPLRDAVTAAGIVFERHLAGVAGLLG